MLCRVSTASSLRLGVEAEHPILPDYAIQHNLTPFISMQNHHSLVYREEEREMFPTLKVWTCFSTVVGGDSNG